VEVGPEASFDKAEFTEKILKALFTCPVIEAEEKLRRYLSLAVPLCYKPLKNLSPLSKLQNFNEGGMDLKKDLLWTVLDGFIDKEDQLTSYLTVICTLI